MRWLVALLLVFSVLFGHAAPALAGAEGNDPHGGGHHGGHHGGHGHDGHGNDGAEGNN